MARGPLFLAGGWCDVGDPLVAASAIDGGARMADALIGSDEREGNGGEHERVYS